MAAILSNKAYWDGQYDWSGEGDEWSRPWGGALFQWYGTLLPRIHGVVPTRTILEIGCGYGRWTRFLKDLCKRLIVVDLSQCCIDACRMRFLDTAHIDYYLNDGRSIAMIPDDSVDFVFSFDSLVHADIVAIDAYLSQLARVLTRDGRVFLHHSNLGEYGEEELRGTLAQSLHWRDPGVSAKCVEQLARDNGLSCISQEVIPWRGSSLMIDCMSYIVKRESALNRPNRVLRNRRFMDEAQNARQLARLYHYSIQRIPG